MAKAELARSGFREKAEKTAAIGAKLRLAKMALVTEYRGLTVAQMTRLRRELRAAAGEYKVVKNTLVRRALKDSSYQPLEKHLQGPTGWVLSYEDPVALSKVLVKFIEENAKLTIRAGMLEGQVLDQAQVKELAKMPGKKEILAKLLAVMQAPAAQLLRLVQEPGARVVRLLDAVRKSKES
ncbi:MAG TPA: 50S ribosomal protein L10 [Candidatus Acidoferrales bacterium]|nr:50S ribosomal protein L10 [Candidatus Acidoferrales bacterium]